MLNNQLFDIYKTDTVEARHRVYSGFMQLLHK